MLPYKQQDTTSVH